MLNRRCFISSVLCVLRSHIIIFRLVVYQNAREKKSEKIFQKEKQQKEQKRKKKNHRLARKAQRMNAFEAH